MIITSVLLLIIGYISLIGLVKDKSIKSTLITAKTKIKSLILPYLLILVSNAIYLTLVFTLFFLTYVEASLIIPGLLLLIVIILINIQRLHFVSKFF